jgi:hypothetical protein
VSVSEGANGAHATWHGGGMFNRCLVCGAQFATYTALVDHYLAEHRPSGRSAYWQECTLDVGPASSGVDAGGAAYRITIYPIQQKLLPTRHYVTKHQLRGHKFGSPCTRIRPPQEMPTRS